MFLLFGGKHKRTGEKHGRDGKREEAGKAGGHYGTPDGGEVVEAASQHGDGRRGYPAPAPCCLLSLPTGLSTQSQC